MTKFEDEPWYREWHEVLNRVIAAQMVLDRTIEPAEREVAQKERDAAMEAYRAVASKIR
jgi:hypothetical protein